MLVECDGWIVYLKIDPRLYGFHSDVHFWALPHRIGLPSHE